MGFASLSTVPKLRPAVFNGKGHRRWSDKNKGDFMLINITTVNHTMECDISDSKMEELRAWLVKNSHIVGESHRPLTEIEKYRPQEQTV